MFRHQNFPRRERGSNLGPLAQEASELTTELSVVVVSGFQPEKAQLP